MSVRGSFVRVNRDRGLDPRTAYLPRGGWELLAQVWAIAADEGEADGDDVLVPAKHVTPERVVLEMQRGDAWTLADVQSIMALFYTNGSMSIEANGMLVRVCRLSAYNRDRMRRKTYAREKRQTERENGNPHSDTVSDHADTVPQNPERSGGAGAGAGELQQLPSPSVTGCAGGATSDGGQAAAQSPFADLGVKPSKAKKPRQTHGPFRAWMAAAVETARAAKLTPPVVPALRSKTYQDLYAAWKTLGDAEASRLWARWVALPERASWHRDQGHGFPRFSAAVRDGDHALTGQTGTRIDAKAAGSRPSPPVDRGSHCDTCGRAIPVESVLDVLERCRAHDDKTVRWTVRLVCPACGVETRAERQRPCMACAVSASKQPKEEAKR